MIARRTLLKGLAAGGLAAVTPGALVRPAYAQPSRITVTSYGGTWEKAVREIYAPFFTKKTGVQVDVVLGGPPQWLAQIAASAANPPIHATLMSVELAIEGGRKGFFEKPSPEKLSNLKDVPQQFIDAVEGYGVCTNYGAAVFGYHKERLRNPPKSYKELVDRTAKGEIRTTVPGAGYAFMPTMLLWSLADALGGGVDNVEPAFEAIKRMRPNLVFWNQVTAFTGMLQTGEADCGIWFDGRIWDSYDQGNTWLGALNPQEGAPMIVTPMVKVKNAPDVAWEYINSMLAPGPQLEFAKLQNYPVTNRNVVYPPALTERFTPWDKTRLPPSARLLEVVPSWIDRWNREIRG